MQLSESIRRVYGLDDDSVLCDYCGRDAEEVTGREVYPHRKDLWEKVIWRCTPCKAYVGCHSGTNKPFGRLANDRLRKMKMRAHGAFDPLWEDGEMGRKEAYAWLAKELGIHQDECHIGMFDESTCCLVIKAVEKRKLQ